MQNTSKLFLYSCGDFCLSKGIEEGDLSHTIYSSSPADRANESEIAAWQHV